MTSPNLPILSFLTLALAASAADDMSELEIKTETLDADKMYPAEPSLKKKAEKQAKVDGYREERRLRKESAWNKRNGTKP